MTNIKQEITNDLKKITDIVDLDSINAVIKQDETLKDLIITKNTLQNISKWALNGESDYEIAKNLEISKKELDYLLKICPSILVVMQHSRAFADVVVAGTLFQTAIGGKTIKKKMPIKIKDYENGSCIGEHVEIIEIEETTEPNPLLLKFLAEHKLSEQFGKEKVDNNKIHREIIDAMTPEQLETIEILGK